ncbi:MAG: ABC transporter ATP-binding protein [Candidatus Saccharibacteria bacterium]|nr:ABC transporter ATP-binding protein [Candidatus Saccharibacteria bacterium]
MADNKEVAISVHNLHKDFILPQHKNTSFKQTVVNIVKKNKKVTQKVLDGISLDINKGDFFGIVGRNGSGKSTLLKLIAGVYTPTAGHIEINGELTPFIELGVGFNPELTGRDNVYLNGALLGFNHKQMDSMYDEIVAFAEIEPFMDQKLKNYSSGMQVRLAFSIAIKAENDILMFDEVLAVGDANFQEKCLKQFEDYKSKGKTIVLVTHAMPMVAQFCNRVALLNYGKIDFIGDPTDAINRYNELNQMTENASLGNKV